MINENEHWKVVSTYIISVLSILVILVIAWVIKKYLITSGGSNGLGVAGFIFIMTGLIANETNLKLKDSMDVITPEKLNKWLYFIFLLTGLFLMFLWLL